MTKEMGVFPLHREGFRSRLGFLLVSAGCAIGIGNVWRFPTVAGQNGGGVFVLFYLLFLLLLGVPVLSMEIAVGRAARATARPAYAKLEPKGTKWHWHGPVCLLGCCVLMMYYTTVSGWMLCYMGKFATGSIRAASDTAAVFSDMLSQPGTLTLWMAVTVAAGFLVCSLGLQKGVERMTKWMMAALFVLIILLAVHSFTLDRAGEGLRFYLLPDWERVREAGLGSVIVAAMNQAFFTLSLGIGAMEIFGSYMSRQNSIGGEALRICALDTFIAVCAGLIIFPACFSYGIAPDAGPSLIFITLPRVFASLPGGRVWGTLFFAFMTFASFTTVTAVFENILASLMELLHWSRKRASLVGGIAIFLLSMPCVLGYNLWSGIQPLGPGSTILDAEDFLVSNLLLPLGSLVFLLFCVTKRGWGFDNYLEEVNAGTGLQMPRWLRPYLTFVTPVLILLLFIMGLIG